MTSRRLLMTARSIRALAPEDHAVDWFDLKTPGLALQVTPAGSRTWYLFYTKGRKPRRAKLGPLSDKFDLSAARDKARTERVRIDHTGADPAAERHAARDVLTINDLADLYLALHAKAKKKSWKDDRSRLKRSVRRAWGPRPVAEITRKDVHALLDKIAAAGHPVEANRVQSLISKLFNFAVDRSHVEQNPCYRMAKRGQEHPCEVVADDAALRGLWTALEGLTGPVADAIRLRLWTGQRGGEVYGMHWADVDLAAAIWTIPAAAAKNGRSHRVPLTAGPLTLLARRLATAPANKPRVFPGLSHSSRPMRRAAAIPAGAYTWHDLRRTVGTRLGALGFSDELIGRVLNHAARGITGRVYNQHKFDLEKRAALEAWERELARILADAARPAAEVVSIHRGRA